MELIININPGCRCMNVVSSELCTCSMMEERRTLCPSVVHQFRAQLECAIGVRTPRNERQLAFNQLRVHPVLRRLV
ncbi:hypothetical protein NDU88_005380 [Pleurodeles waltl]|uniref:SWIM-type domain-containing protein n=1 Tax=Pleurodeles waltl TaxID=8319 RepID=A0AAV7QHZ5_PLEWA|nr:hypothetical protein NDU88_005380 [Pleurodeles waltl]